MKRGDIVYLPPDDERARPYGGRLNFDAHLCVVVSVNDKEGTANVFNCVTGMVSRNIPMTALVDDRSLINRR